MHRRRFGHDRRLTSTREHDAVLSQPAWRRRGNLFSVLARDTGMQHPRLGLIVPRRHVKRAVERNRIKRQIRECFRESQEGLPPMDIVVMAHAAVAGCSTARLRESLEQSFAQLRRDWEREHR